MRLEPRQRPHAGEHRQYLVRATYLEIYQEEVRDLLSKNPNQRLEVKESAEKGVYVKGLVQFVVKSIAEINSVLQVCAACMLSNLYYTHNMQSVMGATWALVPCGLATHQLVTH